MAKRKSKKKSFQFWQWALVALAALGLYQGLSRYLKPPASPTQKPSGEKPRLLANATPTPAPKAGPLAEWSFESTAPLLPPGAYPDNYQAVAGKQKGSGLIGYAKTIPGKKPDPQGLAHTQPGLGFYQWKDSKYQSQELKFSELGPSLEDVPLKQLTGIPVLGEKPLIDGPAQVFTMKLFLEDDPRQLNAFVSVDENGARWASLSDGKTLRPAAFWQGTTRSLTRKVRTERHDGKDYVIVETGRLNPGAPYEGYRWKVEAFRWDGKTFAIDADYSEKLTRKKTS